MPFFKIGTGLFFRLGIAPPPDSENPPDQAMHDRAQCARSRNHGCFPKIIRRQRGSQARVLRTDFNRKFLALSRAQTDKRAIEKPKKGPCMQEEDGEEKSHPILENRFRLAAIRNRRSTGSEEPRPRRVSGRLAGRFGEKTIPPTPTVGGSRTTMMIPLNKAHGSTGR